MHNKYLVKNIFILCMFISSNLFVVSIAENNDINNSKNELCFGYIIPLPSGKDNTYETLQNSKVRFLVNDLLRENIEVFWTIDSLITNVMTLYKIKSNIKFEKGAFIIPFTGNNSSDQLITSIIIDYNISSEINDDNLIISSYILLEEINLKVLKLVEPKIAQHFDIPTRYGWPCYLQIAESGGFLNFDFLIENEVSSELNNNNYNVFMWPYEPNPARLNEVVISLSKRRDFEIIRSFVSEGGGFIGSCYGALAASSGFLNPLSGLHLLQAYNPSIPFLPFSFTLSMSDSLMMERPEVLDDLYVSYSKINDNTHPITFSVNNTVKEFFSGPWYIWLGKNTEIISTFSEVILDNNESVPDFIKKRVEKSPSWTVSSFGSGKLILFISHPEFINNITFLFEDRNWEADKYYGRRVIFNSIMYATAKTIDSLEIRQYYTYDNISEIINHTIELDITISPTKYFEDIKSRLYEYKNNLNILRNQSYNQMELYSSTFNESIIYPKESRPLLYTYTFCSILYDYINKSINVLEKIENINYLLISSGYNISNNINNLKNTISEKMNSTNKIFQKSLEISNNISDIFNESINHNYLKSIIVEKTRKLITTFEISLKYFPQIYFEILKFLNHEWYTFESDL